MNQSCPVRIPCPGTDDPLSNYSAEYSDGVSFKGDVFPVWNPYDPVDNPEYTKDTCLGFPCVSYVSQEEADLCAQRIAALCVGAGKNANTDNSNDPDDDVDGSEGPIDVDGDGDDDMYLSRTQGCSVACPDGNFFTFTVAPGAFVAKSQILADRLAYNRACALAKAYRICLSDIEDAAQVGEPYSDTIIAAGASLSTTANTWALASGALPDGLTLEHTSTGGKTNQISGTPTEAGEFNFTISITSPTGDYMAKAYKITVTGTSFYGYWQCEETVDPIEDKLGESDLTSTGAIVSVAGKVGQGFNINSWEAQGPSSTRFNFLAHDFTIRLWVWMDWSAGILGESQFPALRNHSSDWSWELYLTEDNAHLGPCWNVYNTTGAKFQVNPNALLAAGWHRIICWVKSGVEIGMRIDDTWQSTTPFATTIYDCGAGELHVADGGSGWDDYLDEIAIWDRLLTTDEMTTDWNAGAGTTYPTI